MMTLSIVGIGSGAASGGGGVVLSSGPRQPQTDLRFLSFARQTLDPKPFLLGFSLVEAPPWGP